MLVLSASGPVRLARLRPGAINGQVSRQGAAPASNNSDDRSSAFESRHTEIVARTLRWADEAAARCDYVEALRGSRRFEASANPLPKDYEVKRRAWLRLASASG